VLLVGESNVGKTSILNRLTEDTFSENTQHPAEQFRPTQVKDGDKPVLLKLKDTQGFENFRGLTSSFCRGAKAILYVFDITNSDSFKALPGWVEECNKYTKYDRTPIGVLIGNKSDLNADRKVTQEEAKKLASEHVCGRYFETSAKTGNGIQDVFKYIAHELNSDSSGDVGTGLNLIDKKKASDDKKDAKKDKCLVS